MVTPLTPLMPAVWTDERSADAGRNTDFGAAGGIAAGDQR
jgi:hypothetical protein